MRVRPKRNTQSSRRLPGQGRRPHVHPGQNGAPAEAPSEPAVPADDHPQERRARESGGPLDTAHYACECGYAFDAAVSTTVTCPHCGTGQAW
jgi:hypothetical protein